MDARYTIVPWIVFVCAASSWFGRQRRKSGRRVSPRDVVVIMALTWAGTWPVLVLPSLAHLPRTEILAVSLVLLALSLTPLVFVLAVVWLPPLVNRAVNAPKKTSGPHPLD